VQCIYICATECDLSRGFYACNVDFANPAAATAGYVRRRVNSVTILRPGRRSRREFVAWLTDPGRPRTYSAPMSAKYYTQFRLTDAQYRGGNEFSGVVELSRPMDQTSDVSDIEAVLARNFDLQQSAVQLVSWSRLH